MDTGFENEVLVTDISSFTQAVFMEPDGKIIVAGTSTEVNGWYVFYNFVTARFNSNGSLDSSYGTNGISKIFLGDQMGNLYSTIKSILRQPDGKFLVGLTRNEPNPALIPFELYDFVVYRINTLGEYDNSFGTSGKVSVSLNSKYDEVFSMVMQDDNKIVLAGTTDNGITRDFALVRLENCINASAAVSVALCAGETYTVNNQSYTQSGTYQTTLTTALGCDSLLTINLTIDTLNVAIALNNNVFSAFNIPQTAQLQWINCIDNTAISGATNQSYTATASGSYAVVVNNTFCSDTSQCLNVTITGLDASISENSISIFPNPTNNILTIEFNAAVNETINSLTIYNMLGQVELIESNGKVEVDVSTLQAGVYFIKINTNKDDWNGKFIKR